MGDHAGMRANPLQVLDWADRWDISTPTRTAIQQRLHQEAVVPPFTGLPTAVVAELQQLPLQALGQLRDLFQPDLYPPSATSSHHR